MAFYTNLRTDYSTLFSSLSTNRNNASNLLSNINLTDYNNIKTGTYYKLLKAYYAKDDVSKSSEDTTADNSVTSAASAASKLKGTAESVYDAAKKLTATGMNSLFEKKAITKTAEDGTKTTTTDYDKDAITGAVKSFVGSYNSLVSEAGKTENSSVKRAAQSMIDTSAVFAKQLGKVGISVGMDGKLSMNEESFANADMGKVKSLFNGANSYADSVSAYASSIKNYAKSDMNWGNTYSQNGTYSDIQSGLNYNGFF